MYTQSTYFTGSVKGAVPTAVPISETYRYSVVKLMDFAVPTVPT